MSDERMTLEIGRWATLFWLCLILAFCGDPDLHDVAIQRLMECPAERAAAE